MTEFDTLKGYPPFDSKKLQRISTKVHNVTWYTQTGGVLSGSQKWACQPTSVVSYTLAVIMTDSTPRKPRNSRLSAYYGLQPSSPATPSLSSPSPSRSPIPSDRVEALRHATRLTQTLPLAALLQRCTDIRHSSESLQLSLHTSIRRYYEHLDATSAAARSCAAQVASLLPTTDAVAECANRAAGVNARLAPAREEVDKLEGARRATLLQSAAHRLSAALLPAYTELADLCTDPAAARKRLFLAAQRAAVVLPAVQKLAPASEEFDQAATKLRQAMETVRSEVSARGEADDPYGLAVADAIHLRRLLGDAPEALIDAFCSTFAKQLCADAPSEAARAAAGPGALEQARLHVTFASDRIVPKAFAAGDKFAEIFPQDPDDNDSWDTFVVWLSDVLDDAVATRARRAMGSGTSGGLGDPDEVLAYLAAIDGLLGSSSAAARERVVGGNVSVSAKSAAMHVDKVVQALGAGLRGAVSDALAAHTAAAWQAAVDAVLSGERGADAADDVLRAVREGYSQGADNGESRVTRSEKELLHDVARYATRDLGLGKGLSAEARAGMLLWELGRRSRGGVGAELEEMGERVFTRIREDVLERVSDVLHGRLQMIRRLGSDGLSPSAWRDMGEVVRLLVEAGRVGEELGVGMLRCSKIEDELLGDDESVISGVVKLWVEMVRETSIVSKVGVQALQMDASEVGEGLGRDDAFEDVGRAALERCAARDAELLLKEQLRAACQQRGERRRSAEVGVSSER